MMLCLLALCLSLSIAASEPFTVSVPRAPVSVRRGRTATLPCWLSPSVNAEGLEVRWYLDDKFDAPVLLYRAGKLEKLSSEGQTFFGLRDANSDGLKAGDVTLEMTNVTLENAGEYTCYVSSDQGYEEASIFLHVTEVGMSPLLSVEWTEEGSVNVSCESEGWHPKPRLQWSDQEQTLAPDTIVYGNDSSGLISIHSWLLLPSASSVVTCSVGLSGEEGKEGRVNLNRFRVNRKKPKTESGLAGWVAFGVTIALAIVGCILGVMYLRHIVKISKHDPEKGKDQVDERDGLLSTGRMEKEIEDARKYRVSVSLDPKTKNQHLKINQNGKAVRDSNVVSSDDEKVTHLTSIKGTPGFSSGKAYWEVELGNENIETKKSWWVGVVSATVGPDTWNVPTTPSDGVLYLSSGVDDRFWVNTVPSISLPVERRPRVLGVYLNYDNGELSFYNVKDKTLIVTVKMEFTALVYPLFNPGKGDRAPMRLDVSNVDGV